MQVKNVMKKPKSLLQECLLESLRYFSERDLLQKSMKKEKAFESNSFLD